MSAFVNYDPRAARKREAQRLRALARRPRPKPSAFERLMEAALLGVCCAFTFVAASVGGVEGLIAGLLAWGYCLWHIGWWRRLR